MMTGSLRGDPSCPPEPVPTPEAAQTAAEVDQTPQPEQEVAPSKPAPEPPQFDRAKIVPMHRPFMETDTKPTDITDKGGE